MILSFLMMGQSRADNKIYHASFTNISTTSDKCISYPTNGICNKYVDYSAYTNGISISIIEKQLQGLTNITRVLEKIAPTCVDAYYRYACSFAYPRCSNNEPKIGCMSTCNETHHKCTKIFMLAGIKMLPNCNAISPITKLPLSLSNDSCNSIPSRIENPNAYYDLSFVPSNFTAVQCPAPFVKPESSAELNSAHCVAGCCIPCPTQNLFYPESWAVNGFKATDVVRLISAIVSFFMLVSYIVLPDKRGQSSFFISNFSAAIFLYSAVVFFSLGNPQRIQCANLVTASNQNNNILCAVQGAILIFASLATCCWAAALIANLHFQTVWKSNAIKNQQILVWLFCWGYAVVVMCVALGLQQVKFEFANLCVVSIDTIFELFFYPMAAIVCPAFLIHLLTFIYIARITFKQGIQSDTSQEGPTEMDSAPITSRKHKHVMVALQIQWRPVLLAVLAIGIVLFYWIFYFTQIHRMASIKYSPNTELLWAECMISPDGDQNNCAQIINQFLPKYGLMITAESLVSSLGIWLFIIFGKISLLKEWGSWFQEQGRRFTSKSNKRQSEQFFAL